MSGSGQGSARGYSWAPFEVGHVKSVRSGASSQRFLAPLVEELKSAVAESAPWVMAAAFAPTLEAWAWSEARAILYRRYQDECGLWTESGEPLPGLVAADRAESRAATLRGELGLTPQSLVSILGKLASHEPEAMAEVLEALRSTGAELRRAAEARQIATEPAGGGGDVG